MRRCYDAAQFACEKLGWEKIKCYNEQGVRPRELIFHDIMDVISARTDIVL